MAGIKQIIRQILTESDDDASDDFSLGKNIGDKIESKETMYTAMLYAHYKGRNIVRNWQIQGKQGDNYIGWIGTLWADGTIQYRIAETDVMTNPEPFVGNLVQAMRYIYIKRNTKSKSKNKLTESKDSNSFLSLIHFSEVNPNRIYFGLPDGTPNHWIGTLESDHSISCAKTVGQTMKTIVDFVDKISKGKAIKIVWDNLEKAQIKEIGMCAVKYHHGSWKIFKKTGFPPITNIAELYEDGSLHYHTTLFGHDKVNQNFKDNPAQAMRWLYLKTQQNKL